VIIISGSRFFLGSGKNSSGVRGAHSDARRPSGVNATALTIFFQRSNRGSSSQQSAVDFARRNERLRGLLLPRPAG
jgi:hypothetical protein